MTHPKSNPFHRLAVLLLAATPVLAQPASPTLKVNTRLTQVDVTVTDLKDRPIHGLKPSDFTVKEDGRPQQIKDFEEFSTKKPAPSEAPPPLPPNVYTNAYPATPATGPVNVLLVDDLSTGLDPTMAPENVVYSRDQAIKYLRTMPPGTPIIILELADKLRVLQGLTTDRDVLIAALHSILYRPIARVSLPPSPPRPTLAERCLAANAQSQMVVDALENASTYLSGIKGRKNLIWFTPGLPYLTNHLAYDFVPCLRDYTRSLTRVYGLLNAAQIALDPVSPHGVSSGVDDDISLEDLADATGGTAYYRRNDLDRGISEAIATGSDYYSLSYIPPRAKYDGQYHKINIKLDQPGLRLRYREGYTSIDLAKQPPPAEKTPDKSAPLPDSTLYSAMAHGAAPATQIVFTVAITPATTPTHPGDPIAGHLNPTLKLKGQPLTRYDFNYALAPDQITFTDGPEHKRQSSIEFTVAAYNGTGAILNVIRQTASLTLSPTQLLAFYKQDIPMHLQLDLPQGPIFLRAAIRDIPSNKLGTLEIPLTVLK